MSLDLSKQLKTAPITDMSKRFASSDNILDSVSTSLDNTKTNVYTFQDIDTVLKPIELDKSLNVSDTSLNLSDPVKTQLTSALGYEPNTNEDINKAIDNITEDLSKTISNPYKINKNNLTSSLFNSDFLNIQYKDINVDKFNGLYKSDKKTESDLINKYNKNSIIKNKFTDKEIDNTSNLPNYNFLGKLNPGETKTFIADDVSLDYLTNKNDANTLNSLKSLMSNTLKYATTICQDLTNILNTMIMDMAELIKTIAGFLTSAISNEADAFLTDLLNCFDKIKSTLFKPDNAKYIGQAICKQGSLSSLNVLLNNNNSNTYKYNKSKLLYNTTKNSTNIDSNLYNTIKTNNNILDDQFITLKNDIDLPNSTEKTPVYDIGKIKKNPNLSKAVLNLNDSDSSNNSDFISSIPLSFI